MKRLIKILQANETWHSFDEETYERIEKFSKTKKNSIFIVSSAGSISGLMNIEGKEKYANIIIEKKLKKEGQVDDEVKVIIHKILKSTDSYQVLYTAYPLDEWNKIIAWANEQDYHCMVVPIIRLGIEEALRTNKWVLISTENTITIIKANKIEFQIETVRAFSSGLDDKIKAINSIIKRINNKKKQHIIWFNTLTNEKIQNENLKVKEHVESEFNITLENKNKDEEESNKSIEMLCQHFESNWAMNDATEKIKFLMSSVKNKAYVISALISIIGIGQAGLWLWESEYIKKEIDKQNAQNENIKEAVKKLKSEKKTVEGRVELINLIQNIENIKSNIDVTTLLTVLKDAKKDDVRILRVFGEVNTQRLSQNQNKKETKLFIDVSSGDDGEQRPMLGFFDNLRNYNYQVIPVETQGSSNEITRSIYTYQLKPVNN